MPYVGRATDLVTEAEARAMTHQTGSSERELLILGLMVGALSERIEEICGPVVQRAIANEVHIRCAGRTLLHLRHGPITSVTTVAEGTTTLVAETWGVDGDYLLEPWRTATATGSGALIRRLAQADARWDGNVRASYLAGRVADTAAVPVAFKEAMHIGLRNWWRMESKSLARVDDLDQSALAFPKFALPESARSALGREIRPKAHA